ncbi:hypothetical protein AZ66_15660 [Paenibacillus sp. E194]|uniref:hypothetical protein n=1 Tax=Paenibacillus sp. E194 TaxID=1458845 RepID=UPI0005CA18B1|nr:hypothetical protein [Paenibacillus sp. E194]KJB86985.1 hypothetical protein AZ66_15660 [Paenibacillus sp. E194]
MKYNNKLFMMWKTMGPNAYVPIIVFILLILYGYFKHGALLFIVPALEACLPIFGSWWSIFLLKDLLEEEGGELFLVFRSIDGDWEYFIQLCIVFSF